MKKDEVVVGNIYTAKVSGGVASVQIREEKWKGDKHVGWSAVNLRTGRAVYIKSAQRLRAQVGAGAEAPLAPVAGDVARGGAGADEGEVLAKAGSPAPRKPTSCGNGQKAKGGAKSKIAATKSPKAKEAEPERPLSGLDAAAKVLSDAGEPMRVGEIFGVIQKKGLWKSNGKTPEATLYAAIIREIRDKGVDSRFEKKDRGLFKATAEARR